LDAEDEGYVEGEDEVNDNLEDKALRYFQRIIIQLWGIWESAILKTIN